MNRLVVGACVIAAVSGGTALVTALSGRSGAYGLLGSPASPAAAAPGSVASLLALETAVLTRQGISPARASEAINVQSEIAKAGLVSELQRAMSGAYAGVWFDPAGAKLHIGVTSPASRRVAQAVVARSGLADHATETHVRSTWTQLVATQRRWNRRLGALLVRGEAQTGLVPQGNALAVTLNSSVPSPVISAVKHRASRATVNVDVAVSSSAPRLGTPDFMANKCNRFTSNKAACNPPLNSGVSIQIEGGAFRCTAGPLVIPKATKSETYVLTAGHCLRNPGAVGSKWFAFNRNNEAREIGPAAEFFTETKGDIGAIRIANPGFWVTVKEKDPVFPETTEWSVKEAEPSYTVEGERQPVVGNTNCLEGQTTGQSCGQITKTMVTETYEEENNVKYTVEGLVEDAEATRASGDSGGPWLFIQTKSNTPAIIEGTHVGKNHTTGNPLWLPIEKAFVVLKHLNFELLTKGNEIRP